MLEKIFLKLFFYGWNGKYCELEIKINFFSAKEQNYSVDENAGFSRSPTQESSDEHPQQHEGMQLSKKKWFHIQFKDLIL